MPKCRPHRRIALPPWNRGLGRRKPAGVNSRRRGVRNHIRSGFFKSSARRHGAEPPIRPIRDRGLPDSEAPRRLVSQWRKTLRPQAAVDFAKPAQLPELFRLADSPRHTHPAHPPTHPTAIMRVATTTVNRTSVALTIVALCMLLLLALIR